MPEGEKPICFTPVPQREGSTKPGELSYAALHLSLDVARHPPCGGTQHGVVMNN
jgi:hypothetical protein